MEINKPDRSMMRIIMADRNRIDASFADREHVVRISE